MPEPKRNRPAGNGAAPKTSGQDSRNGSAPDPLETLTATAHAAEAAVLGAMLLSPDAAAGVPAMLDADAFHRDAHRTVYAAVLALIAEGTAPDTLTVSDKLATRGQLDHVGGPLAVADLTGMATCPTPASWPAYATVVAREARRRRGIRLLDQASARLKAGEDPALVANGLCAEVAR